MVLDTLASPALSAEFGVSKNQGQAPNELITDGHDVVKVLTETGADASLDP